MRIALDAMGTDDAPTSEVAGAVSALKDGEEDLEVLLLGDQDRITEELGRHSGYPEDRLHVRHAPDRIHPGDSPALVVRKKPDSSIVKGLELQKRGEADAFISGGSTGAVMAASLFVLRPLPGVDRPSVATILPSMEDPVLMLDAGANVNCKPHHLLQFARLGKIYAQDLLDRPRPRIGLLNIGEEPEKGDELAVEAHRLLRESGLNFVGNVEGDQIVDPHVDVVVCDGFVGNVVLKFYESVADEIILPLKRETDRLGGDLDLDLDRVWGILEYSQSGGAPLLGVDGVSIICHGRSSPRAIHDAVEVAAQAVRSGMVAHIARELSGESASREAAP